MPSAGREPSALRGVRQGLERRAKGTGESCRQGPRVLRGKQKPALEDRSRRAPAAALLPSGSQTQPEGRAQGGTCRGPVQGEGQMEATSSPSH